jgi:hypothetical protein
MRTSIEKAGAQQGNLILVDEDELLLLAKTNLKRSGVDMACQPKLSTPGLIVPESMLDYGRRNRRLVLLGMLGNRNFFQQLQPSITIVQSRCGASIPTSMRKAAKASQWKKYAYYRANI